MTPHTLQKITQSSATPYIYTIAKGVAVLYFLSRTIKTCYEIADHIEKRKKLNE